MKNENALTLDLGEHWGPWVRQLVSTKRYANAGEVVREALRLLDEEKKRTAAREIAEFTRLPAQLPYVAPAPPPTFPGYPFGTWSSGAAKIGGVTSCRTCGQTMPVGGVHVCTGLFGDSAGLR